MVWLDLQEFFYVFYREVLFASLVTLLVTGFVLAVMYIIRAFDEPE